VCRAGSTVSSAAALQAATSSTPSILRTSGCLPQSARSSAVQEVRRYNLAIRTIVQVVVGRSTNDELIEGLRVVLNNVSEIKVFSMRNTDAIASMLTTVRGNTQ
jgi:hypothetical protein